MRDSDVEETGPIIHDIEVLRRQKDIAEQFMREILEAKRRILEAFRVPAKLVQNMRAVACVAEVPTFLPPRFGWHGTYSSWHGMELPTFPRRFVEHHRVRGHAREGGLINLLLRIPRRERPGRKSPLSHSLRARWKRLRRSVCANHR